MRGKTIRVALSLVLFGAAAAALAIPEPGQDPATALRRAQLEQELIMAEGTAAMYGELDQALREQDRGEATR